MPSGIYFGFFSLLSRTHHRLQQRAGSWPRHPVFGCLLKIYISSKEINKPRRLKIITTTIKYGRSGFTHPLLGEPARGSPVLLLSLFLLPCPRPGGSARLGWARLGRARSSPGSRALPGPRSAGPDRVALPAPAPRRCGARRGGAGAAGPLSNPFPFSLAPQVKWSCMGNS